MTASRSLLLALVAALTGCAADPSSPAPASEEAAQTAPGRVGAHGMVVAGAPGAAFLSHIPMFGAPHDVQLIVGGALVPSAGTPALPATLSDRLYTYLPDRMSLDALRTGALRELTGTLFLGNFEDGGRPIATRVRFVVDHVVHEHVLDERASEPELTYVLFGTPKATFAAHHIAGAPGFDEILAVDLVADAATVSAASLAAGIVVRAVGAGARLGTSRSPVTLATGSDAGGTATVTVKRTLSCLEGPDFSAACR